MHCDIMGNRGSSEELNRFSSQPAEQAYFLLLSPKDSEAFYSCLYQGFHPRKMTSSAKDRDERQGQRRSEGAGITAESRLGIRVCSLSARTYGRKWREERCTGVMATSSWVNCSLMSLPALLRSGHRQVCLWKTKTSGQANHSGKKTATLSIFLFYFPNTCSVLIFMKYSVRLYCEHVLHS